VGEPFADFSKDFLDFIEPGLELVDSMIYYFP
jgi:hypothetical protein